MRILHEGHLIVRSRPPVDAFEPRRLGRVDLGHEAGGRAGRPISLIVRSIPIFSPRAKASSPKSSTLGFGEAFGPSVLTVRPPSSATPMVGNLYLG
jgi:hypothetical protein